MGLPGPEPNPAADAKEPKPAGVSDPGPFDESMLGPAPIASPPEPKEDDGGGDPPPDSGGGDSGGVDE